MLAALMPQVIKALPTDSYALSSKLHSGRWVKISVSETGLHLITDSQLGAWGFSNPSRVRIYGYGGRRLSDQLSAANYIDDLPQVPCERTGRGLVFYAQGPQTPVYGNDGSVTFTLNPYSNEGYYFLSDIEGDEPMPVIPTEGRPGAAASPDTKFTEAVHYEKDLSSPTSSGHLFVGEDFRLTPTRRFSINLPGLVEGSDATLATRFVGKTGGYIQLTYAINGATLPAYLTDRIAATTDLARSVSTSRSFTPPSDKFELSVTASANGTVSMCNLDAFTVNYDRHIALPSSGMLTFDASSTSVRLAGASETTRVWDVTNPRSVVRMNTSAPADGSVDWTNDYYGFRHYAAWSENAAFLSPRFAGNVKCQDLHSASVPDMVIITHPLLKAQAERVATLHSEGSDPLKVLVVTPEEIANEFGSGISDINAMRRFLKMLHDRGSADGASAPHRLRYALLMGSAHYDHRRITPFLNSGRVATVPLWQTDNGCEANFTYSSDDPLGILADNSGLNFGNDEMTIAVGRIPARTADEARIYVDRLYSYVNSPAPGVWRNSMMLVADDGNENDHMSQTEDMLAGFMASDKGREMIYHKVYVDNYPLIGGKAPAAREKFYNLLNEGVVWWNYVGHSAITTNGSEGLLDLTDIRNFYIRRPPFYYGATCSFVRWDGEEQSGLEMLAMSEAGGIIGGISATREVYISKNGELTSALGRELFVTDSDSRLSPIGEVLRRAKNRIGSDSNKLRYVLLGDPAMRLAIPALRVSLDAINSVAVVPDSEADEPLIIRALGETCLSGSVVNADGTLASDFNGSLALTLYDAECSHTTNGRDADTPYVFDEQGGQLYTGLARVVNGRWEITFVLPPEMSDNFRVATLAMSASTDDRSLSAAGVNRDFYVYGFDEKAVTDDVPPTIEALYLNHESFASGQAVNTTPMLLARVSDDKGLNLSLGGIGHQMSVTIDGRNYFGDVSTYFTPDDSGDPAGDIAYQLPDLEAGPHTAQLKVWDIGGNSATASIDFNVDPSQAPKIFDVYSDANPASIEANFYLSHNRPDAMLSVRIDVYDLSGRHLWTDTTRGRADMYLTAPVKWNLTNRAGQRVPRGIYVYRATVLTEATDTAPATSSAVAKRIAVN